MNFSDVLHYWAEGKDRRQAIFTYMTANPETKIYINRRYCRQLHLDSDLKRMVKRGVLKRHRSGSITSKTSYLMIQ